MHLDISFPHLQFFSIGYNQFTGSIPNSISNATNLASFELASNSLTGSVPSLGNLHNLVILSIGINLLGSGEADDLKFLSGLTNATALEILSLGVNNFGGKLPQHIGNLSKKLEMLVIDNNRLIGNLPPGIEALDSLKSLYAAKNNLSGTIPSSIGKLKNLQIIILELNQLSGTIPSSLGNLTNLNEIYFCCNKFQGMIPSSLANCKKLITIDLSDNNLTGPIPQNIFRLSSLSKGLDLSHNHLNGSLPIEVGNLKQLGLLDLQHNKLSGEVPITLGSCESLEQLDMSDNLFQGSVPSSLRSLRGIRDLNLSRNNLSGNIPKFLTGFSSLELLDISFNNFEGMVPVEGIFKNATAISVQGNSNLCGGIRDFSLPACKSEQPKRILRKKFRIIISAVSALVGAGLLLTCLFLWRSRKRKQDSTSSSLENALLRLSYQTLLKATNEFSRDNLIGSGGFGSVYKGILDDGRVIAVKVVNLMRRGASKSFIAECDVLRSVRHRNLVKVLTACSGIDYRGDDFKALVYEFMDNGSLDDWLHPSTTQVPRTLDVLQRLNIVIDVACALEYLHYHSGTPIVHCDLKPSNVLLDKEMTAHVSDFGLVKFLFDKELDSATNPSSSIGARGTIGYCPPEYGMGSDVSTSGDVFSFGVLVLEMFTGKRPTDEMFKEGLSLHSFVKNGLSEQVTEIIDCNLLQMQLNVNAASNHNRNFGNRGNNKCIECIISIFEIGISCSSELPQERMIISDVVVQLSSLRNKLLSGTRGNRERQVASSLQRAGGAHG